MIADQLTHDRLTYRPDHLDIEMCRGVHGFPRKRRATAAPAGVVSMSSTAAEASNTITQIEPRQQARLRSRRDPGAAVPLDGRERRRGPVLPRSRQAVLGGNRSGSSVAPLRGPSARGEARRERCGSEPWRTCCKHIGHVKHMSGCRCDRLGRVGVNPRRARGHGRVQTFAMQPCELTAVALTATPPPAPPSLRRAPASTSPRLA
ncbi:Uncharacterised protein [Mycobacterium tuberculosis]|nr:Uncharacterised protein [Mycobacterium tuberculosis]